MQIVVADVGNSSIKYLVGTIADRGQPFQPGWKDCRCIQPDDLDPATQPLLENSVHWYVSSVNADHLTSLQAHCVANNIAESWTVIGNHDIPLQVNVEQPASVGVDRLLAALAAHQLYGQAADAIVIDCGTALTIDLVTSDGVYEGGVIIAGPRTNLRALSDMTAALPDLSLEQIERPQNVVGKSTRQAMLSGAYYNGLGALRETVAAIQKSTGSSPVVVGTGGGMGPWRDQFPADWILVKDLVLDGIAFVATRMIHEIRST
ncbi:MAG: type III pantothenate kinase [Pirellulaceae bacterium]